MYVIIVHETTVASCDSTLRSTCIGRSRDWNRWRLWSQYTIIPL